MRARQPALRLHGLVPVDGAPAQSLPPGVHLVTFRELSAVVTDLEGVRRAPPPPDLRFHVETIGAVFAHGSIVPAPPGIVFRNEDTLVTWLELHYITLTDALTYVDGRAAARVHVRAHMRASAPVSGTPSLTTSALPLPVSSASAPASLDSIALDIFRRLGHRATAWKLLGQNGVLPIRTMAADGRIGPDLVLPPGATASENGHSVVAGSIAPRARDGAEVSASFLVERLRWREFASAVAAAVQDEVELDVVLTGPWPAYDFVRLQFGG